MKKNNKKIKIFLVALILILLSIFALFTYICSPIVFQEGNPLPLFNSIIKLNFTNQKIVRIYKDKEIYLTKYNGGREVLINKIEDQGYKFITQLGAGYLFRNEELDRLTVTHKHYSRFYSIWSIDGLDNVKSQIEWVDYDNEEYGFTFSYPSMSISNKWWSELVRERLLNDLLLPNQVLSKNNNFYLAQKYNLKVNWDTWEAIKTENTNVPEYQTGDYSYPVEWHIVILDVNNESDLDWVIKEKLGPGCSYFSKTETEYNGNYRVEIAGDGKDLGSTQCPINYRNYIVYSPAQGRVAFWSTGQECQIGLGFFTASCFDEEISNSFHFKE